MNERQTCRQPPAAPEQSKSRERVQIRSRLPANHNKMMGKKLAHLATFCGPRGRRGATTGIKKIHHAPVTCFKQKDLQTDTHSTPRSRPHLADARKIKRRKTTTSHGDCNRLPPPSFQAARGYVAIRRALPPCAFPAPTKLQGLFGDSIQTGIRQRSHRQSRPWA